MINRTDKCVKTIGIKIMRSAHYLLIHWIMDLIWGLLHVGKA